MGLDIYVGSLTRYYSQDWKTIVEQSAPPGVRVVTKRQNAPTSADTITDPEQIRRIILEWRASLAIAAAGVVSGAWNWDESASAPYFTDKPGWYGYNGLQMLAACKVVRLKLPKELPEDVSTDNAWREARGSKQFRQIFEPPIWLPLEFEPAFEASLPTGRQGRLRIVFHALKAASRLERDHTPWFGLRPGAVAPQRRRS
jgi:hypothetical protein